MELKQKIIVLTAAVTIACIVTTSYLTSFPSLFFANADTNNIYEKLSSQFTSLIHPSSNGENDNKVSDNTFQNKIAPEFKKTGDGINAVNINNGQPISMTSLKGRVVLVNFWTYSCINVLRTVPHLIEWNAKYGGDKGLVIVGVHTPEFEFEKNTDFVKTSLQKYGIKYPVIQDNDYKIWKSYGNNYWPRIYLVDDQGFIRYDKIGEGDYNQTEKIIQSLLAERNSSPGIKNADNKNATALPYENKTQSNLTNNIGSFLEQPVDFSKIKTPELYFGNQGSNSAIGNSGGVFEPGQTVTYNLPSTTSNSSIQPNTIYLEGKWKNNHDNLELQSNTGRIILIYSAQYVNLVAGGTGQGVVHEDNSLLPNYSKGEDTSNNNSKFVIDYPRLYNIVNHQSYDNESFHSLVIDVKGKGFQAYTFTFG
ncbi:MAG: redoxin family protein [Candidatus Nitrosocosmicus sp.]